MFELHPTILALDLARYTLVRLSSSAWMALRTTDIVVVLQESFPLNISILAVYNFSHA